jgi:hypothetical protein
MSKANWDDKTFVLEQIQKNSYALEYASDRLKDDEAIVLSAVKQIGVSLNYASARLKDDKAIVLAAVQKDSYALMYASDRLKDDKAVVLASVQNRGYALNYASDRLRKNINFCIECAKISKESIVYFLGEAKDLFEKYQNDINEVEQLQQNKANEALLKKISTKKKFFNTTKVFKRKLDVYRKLG